MKEARDINTQLGTRVQELERERALRIIEDETDSNKMQSLKDQETESNKMQSLKDQVQSLEQEKQQVQDRLRQKEADITNRVQSMEQEKHHLEARLRQKEADITNRAAEDAQIQRKLEEFKSKLARLEEINKEQQTRLEKQESVIATSAADGKLKKQVEVLRSQVSRLQQQHVESSRRHKEQISTYRTHLLSSIQGTMDVEVETALKQILQVRGAKACPGCSQTSEPPLLTLCLTMCSTDTHSMKRLSASLSAVRSVTFLYLY
ncbi:spermatogenesis [Branchiostoma belcheri]|nr:spermatogenesis [Branchiostoma belcheri]